MQREAITIREATTRELTARSMSLRAESVDEQARTVEAVFATEDPVMAFCLERGECIQEVLLMSGYVAREQVPLLDSHPQARFFHLTTEEVRGAGRNMRAESGQLIGVLHFDTDEPSERLWGKVRNGFVTDVSVGVRPITTTVVEPGESVEIEGRTFRAADGRPLFIRTMWEPREVSATVFGADPRAKIRQEQGMNKKLRKYLESVGLATEASLRQAWEFMAQLSGDNAQQALSLRSETDDVPDGISLPEPVTPSATETTRSDPNPSQPTAQQPGPDQPQPQQPDTTRQERERVVAIRNLFADDLATYRSLHDQAIDEGWTLERTQQALLESIRSHRSPGVTAPAVHSRSQESNATTAALSAGLMLREGIALDSENFTTRQARGCGLHRVAPWAVRSINDDVRQQAMENGHRYADMSLLDLCREAVRLDAANGVTFRNAAGHRVSAQSCDMYDREEVIRAAVSGSALSNIFGTSVNASMLEGYMETADSTEGWVSVEDVGNFQSQERNTMGKTGSLKRLPRGKSAQHADIDDSQETYKIARYAQQWVVDEQDIIDDRFGGVDGTVPREMGMAAMQLRPDLVFALILANPSLAADSTAVFHANHANLDSNAFSEANLQAGITAMGKQRIRQRVLNIRPRFLLVPADLDFSADIALTSGRRRSDQTGTITGEKNPLLERGITLVADDRLGAAGVTDPATDTAYTGSATNWFLMARPGERGAKTFVVGYLRGTGRAPRVRRMDLPIGQYGMGWDINMDIGAKWLDYRGAYQGNT